MATPTLFPLCWPERFPRHKYREAGRFKTSLATALKNVESSLRLFGSDSGKKLEGIVISSNVTLGQQRPADPGVAVWFTWDGMQVCIPVDRYASVEGNLQAVHHIIEARRVELRHGTLNLVRATLTGFLALPAPAEGGQKRTWREVLGVREGQRVTAESIRAEYRARASFVHPDKATDETDRARRTNLMAELNRARDEALQELG